MEQNTAYGVPPVSGDTLQQNFEKRHIRKLGTAIGIALLILAAVSRGWSEMMVWLIDVFDIPHSFAARLFENEGIQQLEQVIFSSVCFTVPFIIAAWAANEHPSRIIPFKKPIKGTALPFLFIGIGFCNFANFAVNSAGTFFEDFGVDYEVTRLPLPKGSIGFLIYLIATAVVPAIVEEFGCRGIIIGLLKPYGEGFAVMTSAIVFGIVHGNFEQIPFAFLVGLVLGFIRIKTDSMVICMVVHFINNAVSVVLNYLDEYALFSAEAVNAVYIVFMAACMLLGIIGILMLKDKGALRFEKAKCISTEKQKFIRFFTSPAVIIFIVLELLSSLSYFIT